MHARALWANAANMPRILILILHTAIYIKRFYVVYSLLDALGIWHIFLIRMQIQSQMWRGGQIWYNMPIKKRKKQTIGRSVEEMNLE